MWEPPTKNGQRAAFSEYRDNKKGILSVYTIGTNILCPSQNKKGKNRYKFSEGTSLSTPLTAGLLSLMMSQNPAVTAKSAKTVLQDLGRTRKGEGWPADLLGAPIVPRMATDLEVTCNPVLPQPPLYTATWYDWATRVSNIIYPLPSPDLFGLASYLADEDVWTRPFVSHCLFFALEFVLI